MSTWLCPCIRLACGSAHAPTLHPHAPCARIRSVHSMCVIVSAPPRTGCSSPRLFGCSATLLATASRLGLDSRHGLCSSRATLARLARPGRCSLRPGLHSPRATLARSSRAPLVPGDARPGRCSLGTLVAGSARSLVAGSTRSLVSGSARSLAPGSTRRGRCSLGTLVTGDTHPLARRGLHSLARPGRRSPARPGLHSPRAMLARHARPGLHSLARVGLHSLARVGLHSLARTGIHSSRAMLARHARRGLHSLARTGLHSLARPGRHSPAHPGSHLTGSPRRIAFRGALSGCLCACAPRHGLASLRVPLSACLSPRPGSSRPGPSRPGSSPAPLARRPLAPGCSPGVPHRLAGFGVLARGAPPRLSTNGLAPSGNVNGVPVRFGVPIASSVHGLASRPCPSASGAPRFGVLARGAHAPRIVGIRLFKVPIVSSSACASSARPRRLRSPPRQLTNHI